MAAPGSPDAAIAVSDPGLQQVKGSADGAGSMAASVIQVVHQQRDAAEVPAADLAGTILGLLGTLARADGLQPAAAVSDDNAAGVGYGDAKQYSNVAFQEQAIGDEQEQASAALLRDASSAEAEQVAGADSLEAGDIEPAAAEV